MGTGMGIPRDIVTVQDYLLALLDKLCRLGSNFDSKRPFGYSSWHGDLYRALVVSGLAAGTLDEDGFLEYFSDDDRADDLIAAAIQELRLGSAANV